MIAVYVSRMVVGRKMVHSRLLPTNCCSAANFIRASSKGWDADAPGEDPERHSGVLQNVSENAPEDAGSAGQQNHDCTLSEVAL